MRVRTADIENNLETKLFKIGCLVSVILSIILAILDGFIFLHFEAVIVELSAAGIFIYFLVIKAKKDSDTVRHIYLGLILVFANIAFFIEGGWATPSAIIFFIGILFGTILVKSKYSKIVVWILIIDFILLTFLEYFLFESPKYLSYTFDEFRIVHVSFALVSIVVTVLLVDFFKLMYDRERYAINLVNKQLDEANILLDEKNKNLALNASSIKDKQEVLEKNHQELASANQEMVEINKYLEETVQRRKKELSKINSDLSMLFYRSSHDFRRPLTTLKGLARIGKLTEQTELSAKILELVDQTADSMGRMLDKFLMLYQINDLQRYPEVTTNEIHQNLEQQLKSFGAINFNWEIETLNYKNNDRRNFLLDIILKNLVENSCFYRNESNGSIKISISEDEGQLFVTVWDNGDGIPNEIKDKVFDIYYRGSLKSKGAGLGLFVVDSAIKKLKATCRIQSISKEYCQFDIRFTI